MARAWRQLLAGAICAAACAGTGPPAALAAGPIALGVNVDHAPDDPAQLAGYVRAAGRAPAIVMWYQSWSEPLYYSKQMPPVDAAGAKPLITWSPQLDRGSVPLADIAGGRWDGYIRDQARLARSYGKPMMIRLAHEMNLRSSGYGPGTNGNTPAQFVAAWRHVVSIFRQQGASNVSWVWSPNVDCNGACPFSDLYPGDAWTDWVALDGYNYGVLSHLPWMSLASVFKPSYDVLAKLTSKPVMIAETGTVEQGGDKAAWIRQGLLRDVPAMMPRVRAVVWFDRVKETDWRVDSSPRSLAAWRDVVGSPIYGAPVSAGVRMAGANRLAAHPKPRVRSCRALVMRNGGRRLGRSRRRHRILRCKRRRARSARALRHERPLRALVGSTLRFRL